MLLEDDRRIPRPKKWFHSKARHRRIKGKFKSRLQYGEAFLNFRGGLLIFEVSLANEIRNLLYMDNSYARRLSYKYAHSSADVHADSMFPIRIQETAVGTCKTKCDLQLEASKMLKM